MNNKNVVMANSILYTISALLVKSIGFLLLPIYTFFLNAEDYGTINLLATFNQLAIYFVSFSLYSTIMRFHTDFKEDVATLSTFYSTIFIFITFSSITFVLMLWGTKSFLEDILFRGIAFYPTVLLSLFGLIFVALTTVYQSILQSMQKGKKLTYTNLIIFLLQAILTIFFLAILNLGVNGVLISLVITNVIYLIYVVIDLNKNHLISLKFDYSLLIQSLKYSIPIMPHNLSTHTAGFTSRLILSKFSTLAEVGLYSVASQFGSLIDTIQSSVNKAFAPWFFDMMTHEKTHEKSKSTIELVKSTLIIYSFVYMFVGLFSQEVVLIMTSNEFAESWKVIPIFVTAYSVKSIYYFYVTIMFYYKEATNKIFIGTLLGSITDVLGAITLIPLMGMYGGAISFLVGKIVVVVLIYNMANKFNEIGLEITTMLKIIIPSLLFMFVGLYFSYTTFENEVSINNILYKIIVILVYTFIIYRINNEAIRKSPYVKKILEKKKEKYK